MYARRDSRCYLLVVSCLFEVRRHPPGASDELPPPIAVTNPTRRSSRPGSGLMLAGTILAFIAVLIILIEVFKLPPYGVLLVIAIGLFVLGIIRRWMMDITK